MISIAVGVTAVRRELIRVKRAQTSMPWPLLLFRFLPRRFKGEQILLHKMGIMLQVDGNHNIRSHCPGERHRNRIDHRAIDQPVTIMPYWRH